MRETTCKILSLLSLVTSDVSRIMARLGRFERPAYGSGGRHSIH